MSLCYLDTETTGLDLELHNIWEIAYAFDDEPVRTAIVRHTTENAEPRALEINRYNEREILPEHADDAFEARFLARLEGERPTLVGANPAFDAYRLSYRWSGLTPWAYRLIDVEVYAMPIFGLAKPEGLRALTDRLNDLGYGIPEPDHSAASDVAAVRAVHQALQIEAAEMSRA